MTACPRDHTVSIHRDQELVWSHDMCDGEKHSLMREKFRGNPIAAFQLVLPPGVWERVQTGISAEFTEEFFGFSHLAAGEIPFLIVQVLSG